MEPQPPQVPAYKPQVVAIVAALVLIGAGFLINASSRDALGQVSFPGGGNAFSSQSGPGERVIGPLVFSLGNQVKVFNVTYNPASKQVTFSEQGTGNTVPVKINKYGLGVRAFGGSSDTLAVIRLYSGKPENVGVFRYDATQPIPYYQVTNVAMTGGGLLNGGTTKFFVAVPGAGQFNVAASGNGNLTATAPNGLKLKGIIFGGLGAFFAGDTAYVVNFAQGPASLTDVPGPPFGPAIAVFPVSKSAVPGGAVVAGFPAGQ
jgi:hypothetical protein